MQRLILFAALFSLGLSASAQDQTCIQTRWTEIQNVGENKRVFSNNGTKDDLIANLKQYVVEDGLMMYEEEAHGIHYETTWVEIDTVQHIVHLGDTIRTTHWADYFEHISRIEDPMGEPFSVQEIRTPLSLRDIHAIRIREEWMSTEENPTAHFELTGLALIVDNGSPYFEHYPLFWISIFELNALLEDQPTPKWLAGLQEHHYKGFVYMQRPCSDQ